jgi:hypothetical protein
VDDLPLTYRVRDEMDDLAARDGERRYPLGVSSTRV